MGAARIPVRKVLATATPVALGYVPVGILFGALAESAGLTLVETGAMSLLVYSGAAQLAAVQMLAAGAPPIGILAAAAVLAVRHTLMGAALSAYTRSLPLRLKLVLSPFMTDESFALAWGAYQKDSGAHGFFLGANFQLYFTWFASSVAGHVLVQSVPIGGLGLELLFPLLFVAILAGLVSTLPEAAAVAAGFAATLFLRRFVSDGWAIPLAGIVAALVGGALAPGAEEGSAGSGAEGAMPSTGGARPSEGDEELSGDREASGAAPGRGEEAPDA